MSSLIGGLARTSAPSYAAAPLQAYEDWRTAYVRSNPTVTTSLVSAAILRRIVNLHSAGDSFAEIGRCCGLTMPGAKRAYDRLPEHLR